MTYEQFKQQCKAAADTFRKIPREQSIKLISHLDSDGICACSIIIKALNRDNRKYSISIVQQVDELLLDQITDEDCQVVVFTDIGSGQYSLIHQKLHKKQVFILDHHLIDPDMERADNITQVNPNVFGIDGSQEISGAGVAYFFASFLDRHNVDMAHVAIIGATGDLQEKGGFKQLNSEILDVAIKCGKIEIKRGLRIYGSQSKPLYKLLEQSKEHIIPGVSGSESNSVQFLQHLGINPKNGSAWKKLSDLTDDEMKKLVTEIIIRRLGEKSPESIIGTVYILSEETKNSIVRDVQECSTLLNACGRLGKASLGIGVCLNDPKIKEKAIQSMAVYKRQIMKALDWYNNAEPDAVMRGAGYMIINAQQNVMPTMIGTLASILSKSNDMPEGTLIMSLAQVGDGNTKISLRIAGNHEDEVDLMHIVTEIASKVDGSAGGHRYAAGAVIKTAKDDEFLEYANKILSQKAGEMLLKRTQQLTP